MLKKKYLSLLLAGLLMSCQGMVTDSSTSTGSSVGSSDSATSSSVASSSSVTSSASSSSAETVDFESMFAALTAADSLTLTGTSTRIYSSADSSSEAVPDEVSSTVIKFSPDSYSYTATGAHPTQLGVWNEDGKPVQYYVDSQNQISSKEISLNGSTLNDFDFFANPFKKFEGGFLKETDQEGVYDIDLTSDATKAVLTAAAPVLTLYTLTEFSQFRLSYVDGVFSLDFSTPSFSADYEQFALRSHFTIDLSAETDHTTPKPEPLPHYDYQDRVKAAFDQLSTSPYKLSYVYKITDNSYDFIGDYYKTEKVNLVVTSTTEADATKSVSGYYEVEDKWHEIKKLPKREAYCYSSEEASYPLPKDVHLAIAPEFFIQDGESYTVSDLNANADFAEGISPFLIAYAQVTKTVITLDAENRVSTMRMTGATIDISFTFSYDAASYGVFDSLKMMDPLSFYDGKYTFSTTPEQTFTIVVAGSSVTLNGKSGTDVKINNFKNYSFMIGNDTYEINYSSYSDSFTIFFNDGTLSNNVTFTPND